MLPKRIGSQPTTVRGLYGYDLEGVRWEQSQAIIFGARRRVDGRRVLVKLLGDSPPPTWGPDWLQRDFRIAQGLETNCAVKPIGFEQTDLGPALIYADEGAQPLEELANRAPLDTDTFLTIGAKLAEAVAALHKEQLIHCNLNPGTVWLNDTSDGVLISDFGCSRLLFESADQGMPLCDGLIDLRYMSPEQSGRIQTPVDQRTDIYSLGIILFQLLVGEVPFDSPDPRDIVDGHVARQPKLPAELCDMLPAGLVKVIFKALAKSPEGRYLSATGLVADLLECRSLWRSSNAISDFEPARHDAKSILRVSRRLYGRERDVAMLLDKAKSAQCGRPALLLVNGAIGVGKSALLSQLKEFTRENGRFVSGKFDQYKSDVPYSALIQALQQFIGQLLSENKEQLGAWRVRILDALGNNAQVVIDIIPELELITGPQPSVPALGPVQARNRFTRAFANLIQAFASPGQLLCVVMDDLQWADAASLALLTHVLTDPDTRNILFAGAYRDDEVGPSHPLEKTLRDLGEAYVDVQVQHLNELDETDVLQLLGDTFNAAADEARDLSQVLYRNSGGDPLYLTQLLHLLCDEELIKLDYSSGKWIWDLPRIQQTGLTQDILDLLSRRLQGLHADTRSILATAACMGSSFEVRKVAIAAGRSRLDVLECMRVAVEEGLILPLQHLPSTSSPDSPSDKVQTNKFSFLHDRIQQAAFDCIPSDAKKRFRLQIGWRLMTGLRTDDELVIQPDVLSNLNYAWELIDDEGERLRVARLNRMAGGRAREALAYQDALGYISVALGLLGENPWQSDYELAFELHSEALECEYLMANFQSADRLFKTLVANARSKLDKARTYRTKILLDTSEERYEQAIEVGMEALRLFDIRYLRHPSRLHLIMEMLLVRLRMRGRKPKDLLHTKEIKVEKIAALRILLALGPTAYFLSPNLLMYTALKVVNYSLRHGITPLSAGGFVLYGMCLGAVVDDYEQGYDFGRFALELAEKGDDPSIFCKVLYIFAAMIKPWRDPIDETFPLFDRVRRLALEVGEHQYVNYAIGSSILPRITRGCSLHEALRVYEEHGPFVLHSKDVLPVELITMYKNCALALQGNTLAPYSLSDGAYDETASELHYRNTGNLTLVFFQCLIRLQLACLFGRYEEAFSLSEKSEAIVRSAAGFPQLADHYLYRGLAAAAVLSERNDESEKYHKILRHCLHRLHLFAINSPHNFHHHEALLQAETSRASSQNDALHHYNRSIELAEGEGFTHLVGLANERAAVCCLTHGHRQLASWYLACSRSAYEKWGATAKVAWLDREYATLLPSANISISPVHQSNAGDRFDVAAALQASDIIASGENPDTVLRRLMQIIRVQAGAETAQLLALEGGKLRLEAYAAADSGDVALFPSSTTDIGSFSPAVVNYVLHTDEDVILVEADTDPRFARCPYVASRRPKSVICSGIRHQGELLGVIYLEHTQVAGAFGGQKLEWLRLLSTEVGMTVWTGRLNRYRDYVRRFAPTAVSKEIDANPISPDLAARDCDISILFADLAGYTRMAELMERRQLTELINRAFSRFVDEIHRYDGVLLEIGGDELFVLFGDEDRSKHVWKAAKAALAITSAAATLKEELSSAYPPLMMNIGINSGVASVGLHSVEATSGSRWRYGASGTVVNIAARVRELARDGHILMTAGSVARVRSAFLVEDLGEHSLKNVMRPVGIYRLVGERTG